MTNMLQIPILLVIAELDGSAYGMAIIEAVKIRYGKEMSVGTAYMTLKRMEKDQLIRSKLGKATKQRGGRRKRQYFLVSGGRHYLMDYYKATVDFWHDLEHYLSGQRFI